MDISVQYVDSVKEVISSNDWGQLWSNCKQGSSTFGSLVELGIALEDALVLLSTSAPPLEGCEACSLEKQKECEGSLIDQDESLVVKPQNKLKEHVMLPCSQNILVCDAPVSGKEEISNTASDGQCSLKPSNITDISIVSVPTSSKRVSAMKGSREKQGVHVEKLSVKWAPDVYDPPATSQSHTVKSYNQYCSKMSKKSSRHKHKGKSPRSNSVDKKKRRKSSSKVSS